MSNVAQPNGDDHPEAAGKHLIDSHTLVAAGRSDGAAYLAGYVVECCLKTLVLFQAGAVAAIHDLNSLTSEALKLAALPGSKTARYVPSQTPGHPLYHPANGWAPGLRYRPPGHVAQAEVVAWIAEAELVYNSTIVPMKLDGVI
ncbi:MAG: hypothetical protein HY726_16835 [Candidatus Rokubacteria bacterium]|nr:hypothetical protein [Candidatus Rokubacteria bacterium]